MLYETVHLQQNYELFSHHHAKEPAATANRTKVKRTNSLNNMQSFINQQKQVISRRGSYVVGQKLRESKWFTHDELKIFCAVIETGFIVQRKSESSDELVFGIAVWNPGEDKSKNSEFVKIYTLYQHRNNFRVAPLDLFSFWPSGSKLRIYNQSDKTETPHSKDVIRSQIEYALGAKQKWHNTEHFTYWCRYGPIQMSHRVRNITDSKWGNFGLNSGFLQIKKRIRRLTNGN